MLFHEDYFYKFEEKFEKVARRATKLGLPVPTYTTELVVRFVEANKTAWNPLGETRYLRVEFTGEAPVIEGHTLVAALDHATIQGQTLVRFSPGQECDLSTFHSRQTCDHCKTDRRRNSTLVLRTPAGELIQIGRNCAADFFRSKELENVIRIFEACREISDEEDGTEGGWRAPRSVDLRSFLRLLCWTCERYGYVSKAKAQQTLLQDGRQPWTTAEHLLALLTFDQNYAKQFPLPMIAEVDSHQATALEIEAMLLALDPAGEFERTLHVIAQSGRVPYKYAPHLAYAYAMWAKRNEKTAETTTQKHWPAAEGAKFAGSVKATVLSCPTVDTAFGPLRLLSMQVEDGSVVLWKSATAPALHAGDGVILQAFKVKAHQDYKGRPQTVITHVKLQTP